MHWEGSYYSSDFYVDTDKVHYLIEVKAGKQVGTALVQAKNKATGE